MRFHASLPFVLLALAALSQSDAAGLVPANLRTEYLHEPRGLDVVQPRLSWQLQPADPASRGLAQSAYHLLVATRAELLRPGRADLWDSGERVSPENTHITYAGRPLAALQDCFWSVRVRDQAGAWSPWSPPARWSMGLLSPADWSAQWIGTGESFRPAKPGAENTLPDPWFRRVVPGLAQGTRGTATVASVGYHELYVNGRKVGDAVLMPAVTDHSRRARAVTYDLTGYLQPGENVVGLWLGTGWSIYPKFETADKPRAPIVLAQFDLMAPDGRTTRLGTDATWKTHPSPSQLLGVWNFMNFGGEIYDARREIAGWASPGLDDSTWQAAQVFAPQLVVSAERLESNRLLAEIKPAAIAEPEPGVYRVDFGRNFAGWVEARVAGEPGDRIEFQFSERPDAAVTHRPRSTYIVGPAGTGVFRHRFNYSSARWVTVRGLRRAPAAADFRGWLVRSDFASAAAFECSNPLFNEINAATRWTFENLALGGYVVDCPQRERMGYGGDGHATTTTGLNHYQLGAFYSKWAEDWRDSQNSPAWAVGTRPGVYEATAWREKGNLPYTAPTYWGGGGPAWSGFCVHLPWEVYRHYGDQRILADNFATIAAWLGFLETKSRDDLLVRWGGQWDFLGDWLWPDAPPNNATAGFSGDAPEALFLNNCYWIYNLATAARIAAGLGRTPEAAAWSRRADAVRRAAHRRFFQAADASYVNGYQAYLALALMNDVPPPELRPAVWQRFEREIREVRQGHIHAGITGGAFLFKTLLEARRDDLIYPMVNHTTYPSWGHLLRQGHTTIPECWEGCNRHSWLHSSYLYVGAWFIHGVLGIQPDSEVPGFRRFAIHPGPLDQPDLSWARGHYDSLHGRIAVAWKRAGDHFTLDATVPPGTTAQVHLPTTSGAAIREGGRPLASAPGTKLVGPAAGRTVVELASGTYQLSCPGTQ